MPVNIQNYINIIWKIFNTRRICNII